jgi:hypothetical protein
MEVRVDTPMFIHYRRDFTRSFLHLKKKKAAESRGRDQRSESTRHRQVVMQNSPSPASSQLILIVFFFSFAALPNAMHNESEDIFAK